MLLTIQHACFYPLAQPLGMLVEPEIPVLRLPKHRRLLAERRYWIDKLQGRQVAAAAFTLIAISLLMPAFGTSAFDETVGQKLTKVFIVILLRCMYLKLITFFQQPQEKILRGLVV